MTFINSSLLSGLLLAAIPVVLHFVMRARPKKLEFPALRLLKDRHRATSRRMQLRHLLLLFLRSLLIVALVLLLTRPTLPAARYGLLSREWLVLGGVVVCSFLLYRWLCRNERPSQATSHDARVVRGRRRQWCLLGGVLAALLGVGIPWGIRVRGELLAPSSTLSENIPVAAIFIIDTSISMSYQHENVTRLQKAQTIASEHLTQLPPGSRVAVAGLSPDEDIVFQADLAGAASRLESLTYTSLPGTINRALKAAIQGHRDDRQRVKEASGNPAEADRFAREICLVTDLSEAAWKYPDDSGIADILAQHDWLQLYLVDVSVEQPINISLSRPLLSEETTTTDSEVTISTTLTRTSAAATSVTVEAFVLNPDGSERQVGRQLVRMETDATETQFAVAAPRNQMFAEGFLRLSSTDPLPDDNVRHFSFGIRKPPRILLISEELNEAFFLKNVLQPEEATRVGRIFYDCTSIVVSQASQYTLANYDVVCLINCRSPDSSLWTSLRGFVEAGGGALVVTGSTGISANRWRTPDSREVLPGLPITQLNFPAESAVLKVVGITHPVTSAFAQNEAARAELSRALFDKRWAVEVMPGSSVLMNYNAPGDPPALLERRIGSGNCLMFTSAVDNLAQGGSQWNNLVVDNWAFLMLSEEILRSLTGAADQHCNFAAGQPVDVPVPPSQRFSQYLLRRPGGRQTRGELPLNQSSVIVSDAIDSGHYEIRPFESPSPFTAAFSVNTPDAESNLTRIPQERLIEMIGKDRIAVVKGVADLEQAAKVGRLGIEVFPVLMGLVVILFCAEHLMANFFYDDETG